MALILQVLREIEDCTDLKEFKVVDDGEKAAQRMTWRLEYKQTYFSSHYEWIGSFMARVVVVVGYYVLAGDDDDDDITLFKKNSLPSWHGHPPISDAFFGA